MTTYHLIINEHQRIALFEILSKIDFDTNVEERHVDNSGEHCLSYWASMLASLPLDEAECPGVLHGFCL